jgi:uncharacterized radical SAM superfamily Fe-S cluster-containing enzyme
LTWQIAPRIRQPFSQPLIVPQRLPSPGPGMRMDRVNSDQSRRYPGVHVYTLCWNEEIMLPHFLRHYSWAERIVVYDNESEDGTRNCVADCDNAELRSFDTGGRYSEERLANFKNNAWKESRGDADLVIICDVDELLYHPDLAAVLGTMVRRKATLLLPMAYQMVSSRVPVPGEDLLDAMPEGVRLHAYDKCLLFDPNEIDEINFDLGAHVCRPAGRVEYFRVPGLVLLHYKYLGLEYVHNRHRLYTERTEKVDIDRKFSPHHRLSREQLKLRFRALSEEKIDVVSQAKDASLNDAWRVTPGDLATRYLMGLRAFQRHDYTAAYRLLSEVAAWQPGRYRIDAALAFILMLRRTFLGGWDYVLQRAVAISNSGPSRASVLLKIARFYARSNHPRAALHCLNRAVEIEPGSAAAIAPWQSQLRRGLTARAAEAASGSPAQTRFPGSPSQKVRKIRNLEIHVAHACNLTCESCAHFSNFHHAGIVSLEEAEAWMKPWSDRLQPKSFSLLGGEPTIHPQLPEFVLLARRYWPHSRLRLVTNGFFLHRHPELPEAIRQAGDAFIVVSIHHTAPEYLNRISDNLIMLRGWILKYDLPVVFSHSHSYWMRLYQQEADVIEPFHDGNIRASWEICSGKYCRQLFGGDIYKCAPSAYLKLQNQKSKLGGSWHPYLAYEPLKSHCTDSELDQFFSREEEPICGMCPAYTRSFDKPLPLDARVLDARVLDSTPEYDDLAPFVRFAAFDPGARNVENVRVASGLSSQHDAETASM